MNILQFGKLFTTAVDGMVFAQPLYLSNVAIAGAMHNVLYVATEHDSVYAIDAVSGTIYGHISLSNIVQYLYALDVTSLSEKFAGPVLIQASVAGTASDGNGTYGRKTHSSFPPRAQAVGFVYDER